VGNGIIVRFERFIFQAKNSKDWVWYFLFTAFFGLQTLNNLFFITNEGERGKSKKLFALVGQDTVCKTAPALGEICGRSKQIIFG